ncbi:hypothetical protein [Streptosporangium saharense]|uniref:hypothetical protein n=1 Tax=Streptosporangium saharense TaxID=1706840 RepID=UPI00332959E5
MARIVLVGAGSTTFAAVEDRLDRRDHVRQTTSSDPDTAVDPSVSRIRELVAAHGDSPPECVGDRP